MAKYVINNPETFTLRLNALMRDWEQDRKKQKEYAKPPKLNVKDVVLMPELFQSRSYINPVGISSNQHLKELTQRVKKKHLDPIIVLPVGGRYVLINGHHRLQAYKNAKKELVPAAYYEDSPKAAVLATGEQSAKIFLNSSAAERSQRAWELSTMMVYKQKEVVAGSGTSLGNGKLIGQVRKFFLENDLALAPRWSDALRVYRRSVLLRESEGGEEGEDEVNPLTLKFLKALQSSIPKLTTPAHISSFAEAISLFSPQRTRKIAEYLADLEGTCLYDDEETVEIIREARAEQLKLSFEKRQILKSKNLDWLKAMEEKEAEEWAWGKQKTTADKRGGEAEDPPVDPETAILLYHPKDGLFEAEEAIGKQKEKPKEEF